MRPKQPEILAIPAQVPRAYARIPKPVSTGVENVSHSSLYFTLPIKNLCKQGNFAQVLQECFFFVCDGYMQYVKVLCLFLYLAITLFPFLLLLMFFWFVSLDLLFG